MQFTIGSETFTALAFAAGRFALAFERGAPREDVTLYHVKGVTGSYVSHGGPEHLFAANLVQDDDAGCLSPHDGGGGKGDRDLRLGEVAHKLLVGGQFLDCVTDDPGNLIWQAGGGDKDVVVLEQGRDFLRQLEACFSDCGDLWGPRETLRRDGSQQDEFAAAGCRLTSRRWR
jgi:hypothetical protein